MTKILACTSNRSEYTILEPILTKLSVSRGVELTIYITGSHLDQQRGLSATEIIKNFDNVIIKKTELDETSATYQCSLMSKIIEDLGKYLAVKRPDNVLLLGDRLETVGFAIAANLSNIPITHFSGGDTTLGSKDNLYRDLISLQSSLHFPKIKSHAKKLISLGIHQDSTFVSGYLAGLTVDQRVNSLAPLPADISELINSKREFLLINFHPSHNSTDIEIKPLLRALSHFKSHFDFVFTSANSDPGGYQINEQIEMFCQCTPRSIYIPHLGAELFLKVANHSRALIGNSSAGILETKFINKPTLNILPRQLGRETNKNTISVNNTEFDIREGIKIVTSQDFLYEVICDKKNIYNPKSINKIVKIILNHDKN